MRLILLLLPLALGACSVEKMTASRSGVGFGAGSVIAKSAPAQQTQNTTAISWNGYKPVPTHKVSSRQMQRTGQPLTLAAAAAEAPKVASNALLADANNVSIDVAGRGFLLRQVNVDGYEFAVAQDREKGATPAGMKAALRSEVAIRTGCVPTGENWKRNLKRGRPAYIFRLDCR